MRARRSEGTVGLRKEESKEPCERESAGRGKTIKLIRAQGGCLGTERRRKTRQAAKSHGEPQAGFEPWMSEWGNPAEAMLRHP